MKELAKVRPKLRRKNRGGAPKGNRNALKAGLYSAEVRARRAAVRLRIKHAREAIAKALAMAARDIQAMRELCDRREL